MRRRFEKRRRFHKQKTRKQEEFGAEERKGGIAEGGVREKLWEGGKDTKEWDPLGPALFVSVRLMAATCHGGAPWLKRLPNPGHWSASDPSTVHEPFKWVSFSHLSQTIIEDTQ
jgi:hypothetical protein